MPQHARTRTRRLMRPGGRSRSCRRRRIRLSASVAGRTAKRMVEERNYWLTTVERPQVSRPSLARKADVAVIGAGFTGLSAARTLAKRGARVAVLEAENVGWGASSRNGGMVLSGLKLAATTLVERYGREAAKRMYAASLESIDAVEELVREEGIACDFSRSGHLEVACKPKHFDEFRRTVETIGREFGHRLRIVEKKELASEIGSGIYHGGIVDELSAGVNPARYVAGLGTAAAKAGAEVHEQTRVTEIAREALRQGGARRHQRLHQRHYPRAAAEDRSHRVVHHCDRTLAGGGGPGGESPKPHDLRFEELFVLLPADAGQQDAVWRQGGIFPGEPKYRAGERGNSA